MAAEELQALSHSEPGPFGTHTGVTSPALFWISICWSDTKVGRTIVPTLRFWNSAFLRACGAPSSLRSEEADGCQLLEPVCCLSDSPPLSTFPGPGHNISTVLKIEKDICLFFTFLKYLQSCC